MYTKPGARMFIKVTIKFIEPRIEEIPERCNARIAQSTDRLGNPAIDDRGGYSVQPVPGPVPILKEINKKIKETASNQNDKLFKRGKAMSWAPISRGSAQLPNPAMSIGITT